MLNQSVLTDSDKATIRQAVEKRLHWMVPTRRETEIRNAIAEADRKTHDFMTYGDDARWMITGVEHLTEQGFSIGRRRINRAEAAALVEERMAADLQEHLDWFNEDPNDWRESHNGNSPQEAEHPWGDNEVRLARLWMAMSPYALWAMYAELEGHVTDHLRDSMLDMVEGRESGSTIGDYTTKKWQEMVHAWEKANTPG